MKTIRSLINLVENKTVQTVSPQVVHDKATVISAIMVQKLRIRGFEQAWVDILKAEIHQAKENHDKYQDEELEYDETYVKKPFDMAACAPDALVSCWQKVEHQVDVRGDADYELRAYAKSNPTIESSDTITVLKAEHELGWNIDKNGGLSSLEGMLKALEALDEYSSYVEKNFNVERFNDYTEATGRLVERGIPLILFYTKLLGAKKP
jgi:hypothetical protein